MILAPSAPTTMSAQSVAQLGYAAGDLVPFGTASVHTSTRLNGNIARAGVNYHF